MHHMSLTILSTKNARPRRDEINGALDEFWYDTPLQPPINDFLKNITIRLAAGLLRQAQYSQISDPQVNGDNKYKAAQTDLNKLIMKSRVLTNKQGQALDSPGASGGITGWPNSVALKLHLAVKVAHHAFSA